MTPVGVRETCSGLPFLHPSTPPSIPTLQAPGPQSHTDQRYTCTISTLCSGMGEHHAPPACTAEECVERTAHQAFCCRGVHQLPWYLMPTEPKTNGFSFHPTLSGQDGKTVVLGKRMGRVIGKIRPRMLLDIVERQQEAVPRNPSAHL